MIRSGCEKHTSVFSRPDCFILRLLSIFFTFMSETCSYNGLVYVEVMCIMALFLSVFCKNLPIRNIKDAFENKSVANGRLK